MNIERKTGLEKSRRNYEQAAETLVAIVQEIQRIPVPEETVQNWRTLLSSIRIVDDRIDHITEEAERNALMKGIRDSLKEETVDFPNDKDLEDAMQKIRDLSAGLHEGQRDFFHTFLSLIMKVTEKIKIEDDPRAAVRLTLLEGQMTAKLFLPFLPEEFKNGDDYEKLVHALARLGRAANSFDTFVDLPTDFNNKETRIKPTGLNRVLFLGAVLSNGLSMLRDTGLSMNLAKQFLARTKETAENNSEKAD